MSRSSDSPPLPVLAGKLGGLSLGRQVAALAMWPLLENMLTFLVGVCDVLVSSRMAEGARKVAILDAMGLGSYVGWFFNILQGAVAVGVMALVSRATGAKDAELARRGLGQGAWLGLAAGMGSLVLLQAGKGLLVGMMGLSSEAQVLAHEFLFALAWSGPFSGAMMAMNAALRGSGDTRTPFLSMLVVNVVNVGLSILFVYGPEPWGGHGVAGIAWGTVCGWAAGALTVALKLVRGKSIEDSAALRWTRSAIAWHRQTMMRIIRVGIPLSMEVAGMWSIHCFGIQTISNLPQQGSLGAHMIAIKLESMSFMPGFAVATAAAALTGQYLGAGSKAMAVRTVRFCWKVNVCLMSVLGLCFVIFREELVHLLAGDSEQHLRMAAPLLLVCAFAQPAFATCILLKTTMRGAGATSLVMKWAFSIMIFFRIGVLWMLREYFSVTLVGVWTVFAIDLTVQACVFSWLHFRGKWLEAKV
jgi:putative MATE family efflux protein